MKDPESNFKCNSEALMGKAALCQRCFEHEIKRVFIFPDVRPTIQRLARDEVLPNPKLVRLRQVLTKAFQEKGPTSRAIVFVKTRASSIALKDWMRDTDDMKILQPERFTGAGAREEEGGGLIVILLPPLLPLIVILLPPLLLLIVSCCLHYYL